MANGDSIKRLQVLQYNDLVVDPQCCTVTLSGREIHLFPKEYEVLLLLMSHPGWVLSPHQIYQIIWQTEEAEYKHIICNAICQLRKKLGRPDIIQTVVGYGYKFKK